MRGDEAKKQCPELELVRVPVIRGKADLSKYRNAGKQVAAVLQTFTPLMTRASVDEAYLDLTERVQNRLADMNKVSLRIPKSIVFFLFFFFPKLNFNGNWNAFESCQLKQAIE